MEQFALVFGIAILVTSLYILYVLLRPVKPVKPRSRSKNFFSGLLLCCMCLACSVCNAQWILEPGSYAWAELVYPGEDITCYDRGDINQDGNVDLNDVTAWWYWYAGSYEMPETDCWQAADFNGDGLITLDGDYIALVNWVLYLPGAVPPAPCTCCNPYSLGYTCEYPYGH